MIEISLKEIEVLKLNLQPGEILLVKMKGDELNSDGVVESFQNALKSLIPNNKVLVMSMDTTSDIEFSIAKETTQAGCGTTPSAYCGDCSCGKKEAWESMQGTQTAVDDVSSSLSSELLEEAALRSVENMGVSETVYPYYGDGLSFEEEVVAYALEAQDTGNTGLYESVRGSMLTDSRIRVGHDGSILTDDYGFTTEGLNLLNKTIDQFLKKGTIYE